MIEPRRILIVRLGAMGDVLHAMPAVSTVKASFPMASVVWALDPKWTPLLEGCPFVDEVVAFDRRSASSVRDTLAALRREPFEAALDFQGLMKSALLARASRAEERWGFATEKLREPLAAILYTKQARTSAAHVVDMNLDLAAAAGATERSVAFHVPKGGPEGQLPEEPFVLANPLAGWPAKQWPLERYAVLAERTRLVVNGPPPAEGVLREIKGAWVHLSGLAGLIDATHRARAVVGLDSGPLHLAAALSKPGVALFGPTDPTRNGPYGGSMTVLRAAGAQTSYKRREQIDPSMEALTVDEVWRALERMLG